MTVIERAINLINKNEEKVNLDKLDFDDKNVYDLISSGKTVGIFQLESTGMKFYERIKARGFEDIIAGIALYRPGPMDFIPKYIKGKKEPEKIVYECPQLEPILAPTYGCIVYQEQVMQIVRDLAGYSYGRSDLVRRAMSKKIESVMLKERQNFVYGNKEETFQDASIMEFRQMLLTRSLMRCWTLQNMLLINPMQHLCRNIYQTAYLKYYYPVEFMAALITSVIDNPTKVSGYIHTCRKMGIEILPPDINEGDVAFTVSEGAIRYALSAIKGIGKSVIEAIVKERRANGPFQDLRDYASRLSGKEVNKRTTESFIKAGAFSKLHPNRRQLMMSYIHILVRAAEVRMNTLSGQMTLLDFAGKI